MGLSSGVWGKENRKDTRGGAKRLGRHRTVSGFIADRTRRFFRFAPYRLKARAWGNAPPKRPNFQASKRLNFQIGSVAGGEDFDPVAVGVFDEVDAHVGVFEADAAHGGVFGVEGIVVFGAEGGWNSSSPRL